MIVLPSNVGAPSTITLTFLSPTFGADLTTVTAVSLKVLRRDGSTATWACSIVAATAGQLVAQYMFTGGGEITVTGAYSLQALLSVPGGAVSSQSIILMITAPSSVQPRTEETAWLSTTTPIAGALISPTWGTVLTSGSHIISPLLPWTLLDLTAGTIAATLWAANDGDVCLFADYLNQAATHSFTLHGSGAQKVPVGNGTYATSATYSTAGFALRLKYNAALGSWIGW